MRLLQGIDTKVCIIQGDKRTSLKGLKAQSAIFGELLLKQSWNRVALINPCVSTLLSMIHACQQHKVDLLLLRAESDWTDNLCERLSLNAAFDRRGALTQTFISEPSPIPSAGNLFLTTSGTTGEPKIIKYSLSDLCHDIPEQSELESGTESEESWLLTYHPASFAGLQVLLTALSTQAVLISPLESHLQGLTEAFIKHRPTHVSGTPSFWRGLIMALSGSGPFPELKQITLGGELAEQDTLDFLANTFQTARIVHIYATTEAGVIFKVRDKLAGFPATWIEEGINETQLRVNENQLELRRKQKSHGKEEQESAPWISTGDLVERRGDRFYFKGRVDGVINVGGSKANPEEIEATLRAHPAVADAHVFGRPNPIVGSLVSTHIVLAPGIEADPENLKEEIRQFASERLAAHEIPRMIEFVANIEMNSTGKKKRTS
jgi:acyl-coenzyme A synthetase/AMP-(fatty) acid ligase